MRNRISALSTTASANWRMVLAHCCWTEMSRGQRHVLLSRSMELCVFGEEGTPGPLCSVMRGEFGDAAVASAPASVLREMDACAPSRPSVLPTSLSLSFSLSLCLSPLCACLSPWPRRADLARNERLLPPPEGAAGEEEAGAQEPEPWPPLLLLLLVLFPLLLLVLVLGVANQWRPEESRL